MVELGIISADVVPHEVFVPGEYREWDTFNGEERAFSSAAMMAYAGMIQSIDENVGRVLDYLEQSGELDNTFIIFQSDNGAEGEPSHLSLASKTCSHFVSCRRCNRGCSCDGPTTARGHQDIL